MILTKITIISIIIDNTCANSLQSSSQCLGCRRYIYLGHCGNLALLQLYLNAADYFPLISGSSSCLMLIAMQRHPRNYHPLHSFASTALCTGKISFRNFQQICYSGVWGHSGQFAAFWAILGHLGNSREELIKLVDYTIHTTTLFWIHRSSSQTWIRKVSFFVNLVLYFVHRGRCAPWILW